MSNKKIKAVEDNAYIIEAPSDCLQRQGFDVMITVTYV